MEKKEILVVTNYFTNGGAQRVLSELCSEWSREGHHVVALQLDTDMYADSYVLDNKIDWINLKFRSRFKIIQYLAYIAFLLKALCKHKNAVVVAFVHSAIRSVGIASLFTGNKVVFSERSDPNKYPSTKLKRKIRNWLYYFADVCVFQTEEAMHYFPNKIQKKGVVIPNPINSNLPDMYSGVRRKAIVAAGRLDSQKNIPMLINAFTRLSKEFTDFTLEIYGRGDDEKKLRKLISQLHMESKIFLMGFSNNLFERILDCTMYVSSSDYEGISNSMLEALALGLPSVCTDCPVGGARLAIQDGENGLLVPVGDVDAMYRAMKRIVEEPGLARKLSDNAYKIRERFSIEKISEQWLDLM